MDPRPRSQRKLDTLDKLHRDVGRWVASADEKGGAYLVPLSYCWDGAVLTVATPRTSRNESNELAGRQIMRRGAWLD